MSAACDDFFYQLSGSGADLLCPGNDPRGRPLQILLVRRGHVLFEGCMDMGDKTSYMSGHPLAFCESFHGAGGEPDIEFFAHQTKRNTVVVTLHLDVVVDVDGGQFPLGILVRFFGNRKRVGMIERFEQLAPRFFHLAQLPAV